MTRKRQMAKQPQVQETKPIEESLEFVRKTPKGVVVDFAKFSEMVLRELNPPYKTDIYILGKWKREDVVKFLTEPEHYQRQLRNISNVLYNQSNQYKRLIHYFADMLTLDYVVVPNSNATKVKKETLSKQYENTLGILENMNIKHEFGKILTVAFREDAFFGYQWEDGTNSFIQQLPADYCQINAVEDGIYNFSFDFSFFNGIYQYKLDLYPEEFRKLYQVYLENMNKRWHELDSTKTVCIKVNEELTYPIPPFVSIFTDIFDLKEFKELRKTKERINNYKLLVQKIPMRQDENNNDYMITLDHVTKFHQSVAMNTPDEVGVVTTPMEISDISFDAETTMMDKVAQAERDVWNSAGVSQLLFNSEKSGAIGLESSVKTDEALMFKVLKQIERFINRKLKFIDSKSRFSILLPELTHLNKIDMFDKYIEASTYGFPTKMLAGASLGLTPSAFANMLTLENDILGLNDIMVPLQSAHTTANTPDGANSGGRPQKKDGKLSDSGVRTRDKQTDKLKG